MKHHSHKKHAMLSRKHIVALVFTLVLVVAGAFTGGVRGDDNLVATDVNVDPNFLVAMLDQLHSIHLDRSLFDSTMFTNLKDFGLDVVPEPKGRSNPFASVGTDSAE